MNVEILIMNPFIRLPVPEYDEEDTITNDNQYEKKKKLLKKKKDQYKNNPLPERLKRIISLKSAINDYETKDIVHEKVYKTKSNKNSHGKKRKENLKHKQKVREQQQEKLWRNSNGSPKWSPNVHRLFPHYDKKCIELLLLAKNNEDCIFSILPDESINNILSNVRWDWFYVEKKKRVKRKRIKNKLLNQ